MLWFTFETKGVLWNDFGLVLWHVFGIRLNYDLKLLKSFIISPLVYEFISLWFGLVLKEEKFFYDLSFTYQMRDFIDMLLNCFKKFCKFRIELLLKEIWNFVTKRVLWFSYWIMKRKDYEFIIDCEMRILRPCYWKCFMCDLWF